MPAERNASRTLPPSRQAGTWQDTTHTASEDNTRQRKSGQDKGAPAHSLGGHEQGDEFEEARAVLGVEHVRLADAVQLAVEIRVVLVTKGHSKTISRTETRSQAESSKCRGEASDRGEIFVRQSR